MKNKIFLSTILATISLFTFTACSSETPNSNNSNDTGSSITRPLEIFQFKTEISDSFNELTDTYYDETGVRFLVTTVGGGSDYGASLRTQFASGDGPAIFNIGGPQDTDDWYNQLADLSDTESSNLALHGTLDAVTVNDKALGLPFALEGYGLIYNKTIFDELGIDSSTLNTFEALEEAVLLIDSQKEELGLQAVFAFPAAETWVTGLHTLSPFLGAELGSVNEAFYSPEIEFIYSDNYKQVIDLQNEFSVQPTVTLDYSQQVERLFSLQQVAIIQQGNWVYNSIYNINPDFAKNEVGLFPIPFNTENAQLPVGIPMYWAVNSNHSEEVQQASKDFLDWMHTSEVGKAYILEHFNFIPAYSGFDVNKIDDPLSQEVYAYSSSGNTSNWVFMGFPTDWGMNVVGQDIQRYVTGNMTWEDLVQNAISTWSQFRS